jgi:hypothetical protein
MHKAVDSYWFDELTEPVVYEWEESTWYYLIEYSYDIDDIFDPIPISPEWLERLGWTYDDVNLPEHPHYTLDLVKDKTVLLIYFDPLECELGHYWSEETTLMLHIKFIHQLQNLVYFISGTELTVKTETNGV